MKQNTLFTNTLQTLITEDDMKQITQELGYEDRARRFTVYELLHFLTHAAAHEWKGYRPGVEQAAALGLPTIHHSTVSKKASDVPYTLFKRLLELLLSRCNRSVRRGTALPKELLLVDSTTITVGKTRLPWAIFHGERSGIKLHVSFNAQTEMPVRVIQTPARKHDGPIGEQLSDPNYVVVEDRTYGKIERFDRYVTEKQFFVVRIKDNMTLVRPHTLQRQQVDGSHVLRDMTCHLGIKVCQSKERHRVVMFQDNRGREIRVVTNLLHLSAEKIAEMYKARWGIEVFFRWIKQNLNVPVLFGTTPNAVYGQLFAALITYVLLNWLYKSVQSAVPSHKSLSFISFFRLWLLDRLPPEWTIGICLILQKYRRDEFLKSG